MSVPFLITSLQNQRIKNVVKLRQRTDRDKQGLMLIEGYRELKRAIDNNHIPLEVFFCPKLFLGKNENTLLSMCQERGSRLIECSPEVFQKIAYRDRPEGLLAVARQIKASLTDLNLQSNALLVVAESIEKPGNLGTILRSADAAGVTAVIVCDKCTDINNPNVVRASIGTIFSVKVVESSSTETVTWLHKNNIQIFCASPHAQKLYTDADYTKSTAIVLGTEKFGLSNIWLSENTNAHRIRIPMAGQADSLNVAAAATILLFEAVRQRSLLNQ